MKTHSYPLSMTDLRRSVAWDGNLLFSWFKSEKTFGLVLIFQIMTHGDHTYMLDYMIFAVTSETDGFFVLCMCTTTASPLPKARLLMAVPVCSDGNSPNITTDLFKLRVVICLTGFEWDIAPKQLSKPSTHMPIQIWANFKSFLVMSEPCSLPAYQKTGSTQTAVTMIDFLPVSLGVFSSPLQTKQAWVTKTLISRCVSKTGFCQQRDFYPPCWQAHACRIL